MPSFLRRSLALLALAFAAPAIAQPELRLEPFAFRLSDGTELAAERGWILVPEDRNDPESRRIELGFVRFRSTNPALASRCSSRCARSPT
jgi:hypothetical protein